MSSVKVIRMKRKLVKSTSEAIDALGGTAKAAAALGRSKQSISNYRVARRLPPELFLLATKALEDAGYRVRPQLFGILPLPPAEDDVA
jgi:hypothetical protein